MSSVSWWPSHINQQPAAQDARAALKTAGGGVTLVHLVIWLNRYKSLYAGKGVGVSAPLHPSFFSPSLWWATWKAGRSLTPRISANCFFYSSGRIVLHFCVWSTFAQIRADKFHLGEQRNDAAHKRKHHFLLSVRYVVLKHRFWQTNVSLSHVFCTYLERCKGRGGCAHPRGVAISVSNKVYILMQNMPAKYLKYADLKF